LSPEPVKIKNILIIDDDKIYADTVKDYFATDSMRVFVTHTAKEGLETCSRERIDVVLLDQQLPDAEGHALCPAILKHNEATKIIFATAYPSFENAVKAPRRALMIILRRSARGTGADRGAGHQTAELEGIEQSRPTSGKRKAKRLPSSSVSGWPKSTGSRGLRPQPTRRCS
jgi:CheY-like chemotaxis protein